MIDEGAQLELAQKLQTERGISLTDAMIAAEAELTPKPEIATTLDLTINLRPRVAAWIHTTFPATATHTTAERFAAFLEIKIPRWRAEVIADLREHPMPDGSGVVTVPRHKLEVPQ